MRDNVIVSIIMPSLNVKPYIHECMDSVVNQTLKEIEIICVDAGSTDGTLEVLQEYASRDSRIKLIQSPIKSYGYQINIGIEAAIGKYIGIVETDDYIDLDMYKALSKVADDNNVDVIKADFLRFWGDSTERKYEYCHAVFRPGYYNTVLDPYTDNNVFNSINQPWAGVYRTAFIKENNIKLNESLGASYQDNGLWWKCYSISHRVMFVNKTYYRVRRDNPNSSVNSLDKVYCICDEYDFIRSFLGEHKALEARFAGLLAYYRMQNYYYTLNRIAPCYKHAFLKRFANDFSKIKNDGELDHSLYSSAQLKRLKSIMRYPDLYYYFNYVKSGRLIKKSIKKIRGGIVCLKDHGLNYTFYRLKVHLGIKKESGLGNDYDYYNNLPVNRYPMELKRWYHHVTGKRLNLKNPRSFNEKTQWMKLYDSSPMKTRLADKYLVREWVKDKIGEEYLIPLLGVWNSFDEIDFDKLPDQFVLKANHGSGWNIIVRDKSEFNYELARKKFDVWMRINYTFIKGFELHYSAIPRKILAEQYIENGNGDLYDYKVWCFNGVAHYIQFLSDRQHGLRMDFYDRDWIHQPFVYNHPNCDVDIPRPDNLSELLAKAELLSQGFPFVRVDFYRTNDGKLYFGEMTFTSFSGVCDWNPPETDLMLGALISCSEIPE